jgi:murein DD-endopeptidase MepM/ murein hydrolase activator NlpD
MPVWTLVIVLFAAFLGGCLPSGGVYHTVREGQTLYRISRAYNMDECYLARINGIKEPTRLKVGERLFIPGADGVKIVHSTVKPKYSNSQNLPPGAAKSSFEKKSGDVSERSSVAKKTTSANPPSYAKGKFIWPLKGTIVRKFGDKAGSPSKGLEIASPQGAPVLSAGAGRVIYSGNGISGYGNLIIVEHEGSLFTVYGFNKKNLVKVGAFVSKGERIALSGVPPGGGSPRLHFEIRNGKKAVNPNFYLP